MKPSPEQKRLWDERASEDGDDWDRRALGADADQAARAPRELEAEVNEGLARKKMIAIRLPQSLIDSLKRLAAEDAMGYQTYIRQVLARHVRRNQAQG